MQNISSRKSSLAAFSQAPAVIVISGSVICMLTFGPRSAMGLFMQPMSFQFSWGRDVFALAFAIQNLLWGIGQPIVGMVADRYGSLRVIWVGAVAYAIGLVIMRYSTTPLILNFGAGVFIGFGLSCCSFTLVLSALGKLMPPEWRALSLGAGTAAGSFGQFVFAPAGVALIDNVGWQSTLTIFAGLVLLVIPLASAVATPASRAEEEGSRSREQSFKRAMTEAFAHRSYVLLVLGFFTCGFQLAFITMHLPAYLADRGISAEIGGWVLALIGLFNIFGSLAAGWLSNDRLPKRYLLTTIYLTRAIATLAFISLPATPTSAIVFGIVSGLAWLSAVPPTSGLVALMFGTRWLATLWGFAFFSHQVGGFLGSWLGGLVYERFGSYSPIWWLSIGLGIVSALINLPIAERPIVRLSAQPT